MLRGQISILTRIFFVIALLIMLVILSAQLSFFNVNSKAQVARYDMVFFAEDIARVLGGSEACLSAGQVEGVLLEEKLDNFENDYQGIEPSCAKLLGYGWNAEVNSLNISNSTEMKSWSFGAQIPSGENSISLIFPVSIKGDSGLHPGTMKIKVASGPLEQAAGLVDSACLNDEVREARISVESRIYYVETNEICTESKSGEETCRKLRCGKEISFPDLLPGMHQARVDASGDIAVLTP